MENLHLETLTDSELMTISGGKAHPILEIVAGVGLMGVAVAVEFGSFGAASIPAGYFAAAGAGLALHGANAL